MSKNGWELLEPARRRDVEFTRACICIDAEFGEVPINELQSRLEDMTFFDDPRDPAWPGDYVPKGRNFDFAVWDEAGLVWSPGNRDGVAYLRSDPASPDAWLRERRESPYGNLSEFFPRYTLARDRDLKFALNEVLAHMRGILTIHDVNEMGMRDDWWEVLSGWVDAQRGGKTQPVTAETIMTIDISRRPALKAMLDEKERLEGFFTRAKGEPVSDYAARMLALIKIAKSYVEFEAGQGIDLDDLLDELQEIVDGNARGIAVRDVRRALNHAREHFPQLDIPKYPSEGDIISAALRLVRQAEREQGPDLVTRDGSEWTLQRIPGETDEEFEARRHLVTNRPRILRQPGIMSSYYTIEGTRVTALSIIVELIDGGASEAEIHETYPTLPQGSVPAAVDWLVGRLQIMRRMFSGTMRPWKQIYNEDELDVLGQLGDGDSEIPPELQYSLDDLDDDGNRIDLADRILRDIEQWNGMLAPGRPKITVKPEGLPESVLNRLREIADQYPRARLDLEGRKEASDDDGQDETS